MTVLTEPESDRINEVANRLRLIQSDATLATAEQRREYLGEEISRSFKTEPPANRKRYLEALLARFPVAGRIATTTAPAPASAPPPPPSAPESFAQLRERFLAAAAGLTEPERAELAKRLGEAGLTRVDKEKVVLEITDELRKGLGLPADRQPNLRSLVQLCVLLVDAFQRLDQTALGTMKELAPRSSIIKRLPDFPKAAGQFLAGDEVPLEPQVRVVTSLLGALLAAMLGGGKEFGKKYVERFSPENIKEMVITEGGGSWNPLKKSTEELCWTKYVRLAKDYETSDLVDRRIRDCLAAFVERTVLGGR